ncbi:tether containing UBX domain for GLUT4 [Discoglossus pictus]
MAAGGPGVTVLAPNGRRQTVRVTARTLLLQVLEEVCKKQNFNPREYGLKFQRTVLDLSLQWRFANLPNNASLEMVKCGQERAGAECAKVRVAVQLEDGTRLQQEFLSSQTLWDIVTHFQQTRTCAEEMAPGSSPVCIYMRDEVTGESSLRKTSLQSLGLTGGSAIIRFVIRKCDQSENRVSGQEDIRVQPSVREEARVELPVIEVKREQSAGLEKTHKYIPVSAKEESRLSVAEKSQEDQPVSKQEKEQSTEFVKELDSPRKSEGKESSQKPLKDVAKVEIVESPEVSKPSSSNTCSQTESEAISSPVRPHSSSSAPPQIQTAPFIPFQGGGYRLGGANVPAGPSEADVPYAKAQEPVCSPGPSKPKKSRTSDEEDAESQPTKDRKPIVCHMDLEEQYRSEEPTDEFFELTVDDVRRRFSQLKSERQRLEESPLMTKAMKEAQLKEKLERYPKVVIRVLFPDRFILQGFFHPTETVGAVKEFVRSHLEDSELPFYLFITPPRTELRENSQTLFQADLFPAAVVYFGSQTHRDHFLRRQLLEESVSPSQADLLVARAMPRVPFSPTAPVLPTLTGLHPAEPPRAPRSTTDQDDEPEPPSQRQSQRDFGKVPKWLKFPGKK